MSTPHSQEKLDALTLVTAPYRLRPDYYTDNFFVIATLGGQNDLEKKARDGFRDLLLPDYVYIPESKQLTVGYKIVNYALVCGVYSK